MKRVALILGLAVASTASAQGFEGVVTYSMGNGNGGTWQYMAKGSKVRFQSDDARAMGMGMIIDASAQTMTMMMPAQKMYMTQPIPQYNKVRADTVHGKVTKVGSETVAGVPCDDYEATDGSGKKQETVCVAHGMGNFVMAAQTNAMFAQMATHVQGLSSAIAGGAFPLKMVKSNGQVSMVATKVEKKSMDDALFNPPSDYKPMQMPAH